MNSSPAPVHFSATTAVDRAQPQESAPAASTPLPRPDASEPAELAPVAVRGYN